MDVQVVPDWSYAGDHHYIVYVDGKVYDQFTSRRNKKKGISGWLTQSQMHDIADYYREGLENRKE